MKLRNYEDEDYYQLTNLYKIPELFGGAFDETRDTPEKLLATSEQNQLFVVVDDLGMLVGSIMLLSNPHSFWIMRFVLDDKHPEYKIAAAMLLKIAERAAVIEGHTELVVYSSPMYEDLSLRYETMGFHTANDYKCYWKEATYEI